MKEFYKGSGFESNTETSIDEYSCEHDQDVSDTEVDAFMSWWCRKIKAINKFLKSIHLNRR